MRKNVLPITAGILGSLALAVSASADFTGFQLENKGQYDTAKAEFGGPDVGLVDVWNLYALFSDPGDSYSATFVIGGDPNFGEMLGSSDLFEPFDGLGGGFWNWNGGGNTPLHSGFPYNLDPAAGDADTHISIGLKNGSFPDGGDAAGFSPEGEAILVASGILDGSGSINEDWVYFATVDDAQSFPVDGRVLIFQFAVLRGEHASGVWNVQWITPDGDGQASVEWTTVPAPGALALLGLAGLAGARRRRRRG